MLSRINGFQSMNFQGGISSAATKNASKSVKALGIAGAGVFAMSNKELRQAYDSMPDSFNYSSDTEKQKAAEVLGEMKRRNLVNQGQLVEKKSLAECSDEELRESYNNMPDYFNYSSDLEQQNAAKLMEEMSKRNLVEHGRLVD